MISPKMTVSSVPSLKISKRIQRIRRTVNLITKIRTILMTRMPVKILVRKD